MVRFAVYALLLVICTACGGGNPGTPTPDPVENSAPQIELSGAHSIQLLHGSDYQDAGATATDEEDGDLTDSISTSGLPIDTSKTGAYEVVYSVTDSGGKSAETRRSVTVSENESPVITLLGDVNVVVDRGDGYVDPGAEANDVEDGDLSSRITVNNEVNTEVVGEYIVTYEVSDSAGAMTSAERNVSVIQEPSELSHIPITIDKEGFSTFLPSGDSRLIYVSSTSGSDSNDGLTQQTAVKSIAKGKSLLRSGYPDWLLLKIGDTWNEGLGKWVKSGRSASEPMIVTSYGQGTERPLLMTGANHALRASGGGGSPTQVDNLVFAGLHFYAETRDPEAPTFTSPTGKTGIVWMRGTTFLLIEDNKIDHYRYGIALQDIDNLNMSGVKIRKNIIVDSYSTNSHAQGIYVEKTEEVSIAGNLFDHNGWHATYPGAHATKFNHAIYIQSDNIEVSIKNNIISRSSSHGMQLRPGGAIEGNFLIRNPISILLGLSDVSDSDGSVVSNVVLNGNDIGPGPDRRGWGIDFKPDNNGLIKNNIVAHVMSDIGHRFAIAESTNATYVNNVVYKWEDGTDDPKDYLDPERTIEEYNQLMGGEPTFESFIEKVRAQSRLTWNPDYSVEKINGFFQEGFSRN